MRGVFVSYRREDSAGHTGRLYDRLRAELGPDRVFMDITGIEAGVDFVDAIEDAVSSCELLLVVIGPRWLTSAHASGQPRLHDAADFIRIEVATALKRQVRVIPVLVGGASMPAPDALPDDLKGLTRRQAAELRDSRWDADVNDFVEVLERVLRLQPPEQLRPPAAATRRARVSYWKWGAAVAAGVVVAAVAAWFSLYPERERLEPAAAYAVATGPEPGSEPDPVDPAPPNPRAGVQPPSNTTAAPISNKAAATTPATTKPPALTSPPVTKVTGPEASAGGPSVPNVIGLDLRSARAEIERAGLTMGPLQDRASLTARPGEVVEQNPVSRTQLEKGGRVGLTYATRIVPGVKDRPLREAIARLKNSRFDVQVEPPGSPDSYIVGEQSPEAGSPTRSPLVTLRARAPGSPPASATRSSPTVVTVVVHHRDEDQRPANSFLSLLSDRLKLKGRIERVGAATTPVTSGKSPDGVVMYYSVEHEALARNIAQQTRAFRLSPMGTGYVARRSSDVIDVWLPPMTAGR